MGPHDNAAASILELMQGPPRRRTYVIERTYQVHDPIFSDGAVPVAYCAIWQDHTGVTPIMPRIACGGATVTEVEERMQRLWPGCECAWKPEWVAELHHEAARAAKGDG